MKSLVLGGTWPPSSCSWMFFFLPPVTAGNSPVSNFFADEVEHDYRFVPPQAVFEIKRGTDPDRILDLKYATPKRVY